MVQMNQFAGQKLRHRCREQMYGLQGGKWRGSGGVMNWEIGIDIYTLIYIKWITNENLLYKKNKLNWKKNNLPTNQSPRPDVFTREFYQAFLFFKIYFIIYLFLFIFGCIRSQLQHAGSLLRHAGSFVAAHGLFIAACGLLSSCGVWVFSL